MDSSIIVAILSFAGSSFATIVGIILSSNMTNYRIKKLEEKVNEHNSVITRTFVLEEKAKVTNHRLDDLEKERGR